MIKKILKYIIIFIALILVFNLLLFVASIFPSSWIRENVEETAETLVEEGNSKNFPLVSAQVDNCTDAFIVNISYSIDNTTPVLSYMLARRNYDKDITQTELEDKQGNLVTYTSGSEVNVVYDPPGELEEFLEGDITTSVTYTRYWHGWLIIYRVLLIFFNLNEIRKLQMIIFAILFLVVIKLIYEKIGWLESIIFGASLLLVDYFIVAYSLTDTPAFLVMMISIIIILHRKTPINDFGMFCFVIGSITNFVDFLRVPLITLAMPMLVYIAYNQKNKELSCKDNMKTVIKSSMAWGCGYAGTWVAKWILCDVICGGNCVKSAIEQVVFRTTEYGNMETTLYYVRSFICEDLAYIVAFLIVGILFVLFGKTNIAPKSGIKYIMKQCKNNLFYLVIAIMPIVWYIVLNRTYLVW